MTESNLEETEKLQAKCHILLRVLMTQEDCNISAWKRNKLGSCPILKHIFFTPTVLDKDLLSLANNGQAIETCEFRSKIEKAAKILIGLILSIDQDIFDEWKKSREVSLLCDFIINDFSASTLRLAYEGLMIKNAGTNIKNE